MELLAVEAALCCCSPAVENETVVLPWVIDLTPASVVALLPLSELEELTSFISPEATC